MAARTQHHCYLIDDLKNICEDLNLLKNQEAAL